MSLSLVTEMAPSVLSLAITLCLQWRFSRFRKYFVFFSPSLNHLLFDLRIALFVRYSIIFSSSIRFWFSWRKTSCFLSSSVTKESARLSSSLIFFSNPSLFLEILAFLAAAYFKDYSLTFSFIISQSNESFTVLSCWCSSFTFWIVDLIMFTYSISERKEVLSFQYPGPLMFSYRATVRQNFGAFDITHFKALTYKEEV